MFNRPLPRMGGFTKAQPEPEGIAPLDVIFSCCVCSATFSEVYEGRSESVHGLSDGINPKDRIVTRLWLASCCHVFCSKHLDGGGPPFHPAGNRPRAPCPACSKEGDLFSIRGFKPGEYDEAIPASWFVTPPTKLDSNGEDMEALRFQYMSLITYTKQITADNRLAKQEMSKAGDNLKEMQALASEEHAKVISLEQEVERLRGVELEQHKFKERMPAIEHYLKLIPKLAEQNKQMRERLAALGFQMPLEPINDYKHLRLTHNQANNMGEDVDASVSMGQSASNFTTSTSADTLVNPQSSAALLESRPLKRQRVSSSRAEANVHGPERESDSRRQMPPPLKPLARIKSIKKIWPTMKNKFSQGRSSPISPIQVFGSGERQSMDQYGNSPVSRDRPLTRHGDEQDVNHGVAIGHLPQFTESRELQEMSNMEVDRQTPKLTFRSTLHPSPIRPDPLPSEPSYIRLMDRLSRDTGLEFGLRDPRQSTSSHRQHHREGGQDLNDNRASVPPSQSDARKRWNLGHAFLHQSPNRPPSSIHQLPDPLRSNPMEHNNRTANNQAWNPVTPAPARFQQQVQQPESVVSPFFESRNSNSPFVSRDGVAERDISSLQRSNSYQYPWERMPPIQPDWHEPRGLNGLSFINSPLNTRNEPIQHREEDASSNPFIRPEHHYMSRNLNDRGFIKRLDPERSSVLNCPTYNPGNQTSRIQQPRVYTDTSIPLPSFHPYSTSRAAPLPSPMPSIVFGQRANFSSRKWERLAQDDIRSSSHNPRFCSLSNTSISPARDIFSSAGRRSVRR